MNTDNTFFLYLKNIKNKCIQKARFFLFLYFYLTCSATMSILKIFTYVHKRCWEVPMLTKLNHCILNWINASEYSDLRTHKLQCIPFYSFKIGKAETYRSVHTFLLVIFKKIWFVDFKMCALQREHIFSEVTSHFLGLFTFTVFLHSLHLISLSTGTWCWKIFHRLLPWLLFFWLSRWSRLFRQMAFLLVLLLALLLALFGVFVATMCAAVIIRLFLTFIRWLGASFFTSRLFSRSHVSDVIRSSTVSLLISTPMLLLSVPTSVSPPVLLVISTPAPSPVFPPVTVSGSGRPCVLSVVVWRPPLSAPAPSPVFVSSPFRSLRSHRAPAVMTLPPWSARMPPVSVTAPYTAVRGHVQVPVSLPEFIPRVSKYMQKVAVLPFRALVSVKQSWEDKQTS